jgi:hypothetical protein
MAALAGTGAGAAQQAAAAAHGQAQGVGTPAVMGQRGQGWARTCIFFWFVIVLVDPCMMNQIYLSCCELDFCFFTCVTVM